MELIALEGFLKMISRIKTFFKEVIQEGKKVDWPSRQETFRYTAIVVAIAICVASFLGVLDFVFLKILGIFIV